MGNFIDILRCYFKKPTQSFNENYSFIETDFGKIRVFDTKETNKPVLLNAPDGPNVIEHQQELIKQLSKTYRVICFEFPGIGFSYPNFKYDYSISSGGNLIINLLDILKIERATLLFSCSNGFYAIKASEINPEKVSRLIVSQTPSKQAMSVWTQNAIPKPLKTPVLGQLANAFSEKKFANLWYKYALPKVTNTSDYQQKAISALNAGGCFCLSSLVQGLSKELSHPLQNVEIPATMVWGKKDFTHQKTNPKSILEHLPNCEIIEFDDCGHFPELEQTKRFVESIKY